MSRQRQSNQEYQGTVDIGLENCKKHTVALISDGPRREGGYNPDDWQNYCGQKKISESEQGSTSAPCRISLTNLITERRKESYSLAEHRDKVSLSHLVVTFRTKIILEIHFIEKSFLPNNFGQKKS